MYEAVREKGERGYARMKTNYGDLNLELYCERAPRTCYNFLKVRTSLRHFFRNLVGAGLTVEGVS